MPIAIGSAVAGSGTPSALAARVAQRDRAVVVERGAQHVRQHRLVARRHQHDVRQAAQVGDVEGAVVGRAVVADEPGAVHREHDVELLQADVVDDLVVGALQEGRVDRDDRLDALEREPGGEQHRLLLGDADVEVALGHRLLQDAAGPVPEFIAAVMPTTRSSRSHSRTSASPKTCVYCGGGALLVAVAGRGPRGRAVDDRARLGGVPLLHALQAAFLGGREALALDGRDVHDDRALRGERLAQRLAQRLHVVAVDHAHVGPVELLPPQARAPRTP